MRAVCLASPLASSPSPCAAARLRAPTTLPSLPLGRHSVVARSFLTKLFGEDKGGMGASGSKATEAAGGGSEWQAGAAGQPRLFSASGYDITPLTPEEREAAAASLTDFQRYVTLKAGTERAFTGQTVDGSSHDNKRKGTYVCALGGLPLFSSECKYDSGTGWPSFFAPLDPEHVIEINDSSIPFMPRTEVVCARSGAHLGHVFPDGPRPTRKRYCMNAAALRFVPDGEPVEQPQRQ